MQVVGQFGSDVQFLVVRQAAEGQFGGVEEVAAEAERIFATAVEVVADDGEADVGQVDANLVLAACLLYTSRCV